MRSLFAPTTTYLNTATYGLAPLAVAERVIAAERDRMAGRFDPYAVDAAVARSRELFGGLVGVPAERVAIGAQVSPLVGMVADALPSGSVVLAVEGEFTSVLWPFLSRPDVDVRVVPFDRLVEAIGDDVDLVAVSVVQSADGAVVDPRHVIDAAHRVGARVLLDVTQAAGWLPLDRCGDADWIVCGGYKWLLAPRGTAFLAGSSSALSLLRPSAAGWYAGDAPWASVYGGPVRLAGDARRFDISPAWPSWLGQAAALELLSSVGVPTIHAHDLRLANRLRSGLGLAPGASAIVSLPLADADEVAARLGAAGVVASVRAGRLRLSCHLHNDDADVDRTLEVLTSVHARAA